MMTIRKKKQKKASLRGKTEVDSIEYLLATKFLKYQIICKLKE